MEMYGAIYSPMANGVEPIHKSTNPSSHVKTDAVADPTKRL